MNKSAQSRPPLPDAEQYLARLLEQMKPVAGPGTGIIGHVGIAISATQWIHSPRTGDVVRLGSIPTSRRLAVRRFVPAG